MPDGFTQSDYDALQTEQLAKLTESGGPKAMGPHEIAAYWRGFPPGAQEIVTPRMFAEALKAGEIAPDQTPVALARATLENIYGPQNAMGLRLTFRNQVETPADGPAPGMANKTTFWS